MDCHYPLIHVSNTTPYHFLHGFIDYLNDQLGLRIKPTEFRGDIHLSAAEKAWFQQVEAAVGESTPFWLLVSGGKTDFTIKWWEHQRYQQVVDHFWDRIEFVQVGEGGHVHPPWKASSTSGAKPISGSSSVSCITRRACYHL